MHGIAVDPHGVTGASACWFPTAEEADRAFLKMSNSPAMEAATLERFKRGDFGVPSTRVGDLLVAGDDVTVSMNVVANKAD